MNGFLSDTVKQRHRLRQGDSISPVLLNSALELLLLAILNDGHVCGYSIASQSSNPFLNTVAPRLIKLPAYAYNLLVFDNGVDELKFFQKHLECYSKASNSRINDHEPVAFPLSGQSRSLSDTFYRRVRQLQLQWFNASSPSYLRYLGYPLWFNAIQRDTFYNEAIQKLQYTTDRNKFRQISVYGRARLSNSVLLSRFWHVIRFITLPAYFFTKVSSIICQ
ncbi:uncharacterized protein B0P05DRAFT_582982 [Gilbertella persicaria]|uniref:uncharacterized protein n=1 Tax=Gilbertella persicaria TaxID=101096 RepID=UPI0022208609|nr:uncharacterized protein B0P05DRAFT_582982 [Gilbertella persicaria]KAI8098005.1 hypothetical protein B0P05DRAFT_582982 [Gilbertella persicaria]